MVIKQRSGTQMSESFFLGALLALVGGFLDAYTYILRGGVFANAQTGNIVLLGLNIAELKFHKAFYYLIPIAAFAIGVIVAELVRKKFWNHPAFHWRQMIIAAEFFILLAVSFFPLGDWDMAANISISFLCAMQVESFRKVNGNAFATTMCTGNLRSATEALFRYHFTKNKDELKKSLQYYGIIVFFIAGAVLGTLLSGLWKEKSVLVCCILLAICFLAMFVQVDYHR